MKYKNAKIFKKTWLKIFEIILIKKIISFYAYKLDLSEDMCNEFLNMLCRKSNERIFDFTAQ